MKNIKELLLGVAAFALLGLSWVAIFFYAPTERTMGIVQKTFYIHLPLAITTSVSFFILFICSILYLWRDDPKWDLRGYCAAEIGVILCFLVLVTGSLWAKPVWNTWWTWDPRLTSAFIMWIIYIVYLILRRMAVEGQGSRRFSAVYGIFGFVSVVITVAAPRLWRTIHPVVIDRKGFHLEPTMIQTLVLSMTGFIVFYFYLLYIRVRLEDSKSRLELLEWSYLEESAE